MKRDSSSRLTLRFCGRIFVVIFYFGISIGIFQFVRTSFEDSNVKRVAIDENTKAITRRNIKIYAATKFFNEPITTERFMAHCPEKQSYCQISESESDFDSADAVVFHNADYRDIDNRLKNLVKKRKPGVPYVLWSLESPSNDNFRPEQYVINWTMTYRMDADVPSPYGSLMKLDTPVEIDFDEIWEMKNKSGTWLASNCITGNRRFDLIKKIGEKGFNIDIWGRCGNQPPGCGGVDQQSSPCVLDLIKPYKFYISIENSNCKDYVTEKFWKALGERMLVPIVLSRKYYQAVGAPDSAYIAVDDFSNLDDFVAHLKKVEKDKELYLGYHKWRKEYKVDIGEGFQGFCGLCDKLQDKKYILEHPKVYKDVAWWHSYDKCDNTIANKFL